MIHCWLILQLWDSVIVLCFVVRYFVFILVLQSSWLVALLCLSSWFLMIVMWLFLAMPQLWLSLWSRYFLIILTYYFKVLQWLFTYHSKAELFVDPFLLFVVPICLCYTVFYVPCRLVITCWEIVSSWLSCMWCFLVFLSLSHMVSGVRCGNLFHQFLIIAFYFTFFWTRYFWYSSNIIIHLKGFQIETATIILPSVVHSSKVCPGKV